MRFVGPQSVQLVLEKVTSEACSHASFVSTMVYRGKVNVERSLETLVSLVTMTSGAKRRTILLLCDCEALGFFRILRTVPCNQEATCNGHEANHDNKQGRIQAWPHTWYAFRIENA